jgi:hypothetical protein
MARDRENIALEKEAEKKRRDDERLAKETEEQRLREVQAGSSAFRGAVSGRNKAQLKDLAYALSLSMNGTAKDLVARITEHIDQNEALRNQPRFSGIFNCSRTPVLDHQPLPVLENVTNLQGNAIAGPSNTVADCMDRYFDVRTLSHTQPAYFYSVNYPCLNDPGSNATGNSNPPHFQTFNPYTPPDFSDYLYTMPNYP